MQMNKYEVTVKDGSGTVSNGLETLGGDRATDVSATVKKSDPNWHRVTVRRL